LNECILTDVGDRFVTPPMSQANFARALAGPSARCAFRA
jgi:hypothetical protein